MATKHEHIDLTTLKEVERLLTTNDLGTRTSALAGQPTSAEVAPTGEGAVPLPRRG